jgi:hypothetical protein
MTLIFTFRDLQALISGYCGLFTHAVKLRVIVKVDQLWGKHDQLSPTPAHNRTSAHANLALRLDIRYPC